MDATSQIMKAAKVAHKKPNAGPVPVGQKEAKRVQMTNEENKQRISRNSAKGTSVTQNNIALKIAYKNQLDKDASIQEAFNTTQPKLTIENDKNRPGSQIGILPQKHITNSRCKKASDDSQKINLSLKA